MNRIAIFVMALSAAALAGCGGSSCGPDTCGGCCDERGVCQSAGNETCGTHGAACVQCASSKVCEPTLGQCVFPGSSAGNGGNNNGNGASNGSASGSSSSAASTGGSSGSSSSTTTDTGGSSGASTSGSSASSSSSSSASSSSSSSASSSSSSASSSSSSSSSNSASSSSSSSSGSTGTSSSSSSSSSSSGTTTGGSTTGSTTSSTTTTTGGEGSGTLSGPDAFTVQSALEFTATLDGGGADLSDAIFVMYDAPVTCNQVLSGNGIPSYVRQIAIGEARNVYGFSLQGGNYVIPYDTQFGVTVDDDYFYLRTFYPDGGYFDRNAVSGQLNITTQPVNTVELNAMPFGNMDDGTQLNGTVNAPFCSTVQ